MKDAYTAKEIAEAKRVTDRAIRERADREAWLWEKRVVRGGGKAFLAQSLPDDIRSALTLHSEAHVPAVPALPGADVVMPDWTHRIALDRYRVVHSWREHAKAAKGKKVSQAMESFLMLFNTGTILPEVRARLDEIGDKTIYRWDKLLRDNADDFHALADRRGKWRQGGPKGLGQIGPRAEQVFLQLYLQPNRPSIQLAYNGMASMLAREDLPVPSYPSTARFFHRYDATYHDVVVLRREGEKAYKDKVGPYITRDDKLLQVGDVLFCDGHTLNFEVVHPETGKPFRPTLICWFDWRSRMPVGWEIMPTENTIAISSALRMAIGTLGKVPRVAYIDNGKAFRGKYFTKTGADLEELNGLYARLGMGVQFSKAYEARTKIVERFFRTMSEGIVRLIPSYCGASIDDKPAWRLRNENFHQKRHNDWVPTMREAGEIVRLFAAWYGRQPHEGLAGGLPLDVLMAGRGPGVDHAEIDRHFLWTTKVFPRRCRITIAGIQFESDALHGLNRHVLAKYSHADLSEIMLCDLEGKPFGTARPVEALNPLAKHFGDSLDLMKVRDANTRQRQLKQQSLRLAEAIGGDAGQLVTELVGLELKRPTPVLVKPKGEPEPEITAEERERLEALQRQLAAAQQSAPAYEVPAFFRTPLDRYDFLFGVRFERGLALTGEDAAFLARYEESSEYSEVAAARYEPLKALYAGRNQQQAM